MFSTLIASGTTRSADARGTVPSVLFHLAVITTMIVATTATPPVFDNTEQRVFPISAPRSPSPAPPAAAPRAPTVASEPAPAPEIPQIPTEVASVPTEVPTGIPTEVNSAPADPGSIVDPNALPGGAASPTVEAGGSDVLDAGGVDIPARLMPSSPLPRYPEILRQSRLEGGVRVRFIVNENGRVDLSSLVVLESSHPAFTESVRTVLARLRFTPARVGRERVRQMVEIPFGFELR